MAFPTDPPGPPEQLAIDGLGPIVGERYRNRNTGTICAVTSVEQRRQGWVTVRMHGAPQTLRLATFLRQFARI